MDISSRQVIALGAPALVAYLTWSALGGQAKVLQQLAAGAAISTTAAAKRPQTAPLARNPFAPVGVTEVVSELAGAEAEAEEKAADAPLHLDGTAVAGRFRMAIINGERVFEGQAFRSRYRLSQVATDSVTLIAPSGEILRLSLDIARPAPVVPAAASAAGAAGAKIATAPGKAPVAAALERGLDALKGNTEAAVLAEALGTPQR